MNLFLFTYVSVEFSITSSRCTVPRWFFNYIDKKILPLVLYQTISKFSLLEMEVNIC